jgi:hypothetical protein
MIKDDRSRYLLAGEYLSLHGIQENRRVHHGGSEKDETGELVYLVYLVCLVLLVYPVYLVRFGISF